MAVDIYTNTYGQFLVIETGLDLSSATKIEIYGSAPGSGGFVNSASVSVLAANYTASAIGAVFSALKTVEYRLNQGEVNTAGTWKFHLRAQFGAGKQLVSTPVKLNVKAPGGS